MLNYVPPPGGHLGFSIGPKSNNTWLAACQLSFMTIFNSILHVVSEKIIKNFSQSEAFMAPGSHVG